MLVVLDKPIIISVAAARVWSPYKELHHTIESAIVRKSPDAIQDLEVVLRKHKPDFISLLSTPVSMMRIQQQTNMAVSIYIILRYHV